MVKKLSKKSHATVPLRRGFSGNLVYCLLVPIQQAPWDPKVGNLLSYNRKSYKANNYFKSLFQILSPIIVEGGKYEKIKKIGIIICQICRFIKNVHSTQKG